MVHLGSNYSILGVCLSLVGIGVWNNKNIDNLATSMQLFVGLGISEHLTVRLEGTLHVK